MNTKSKFRKISLIVLATVLIAFLATGAWLTMSMHENGSDGANEAIVSNTASTQYFKERPYVMAETEELADAYAAKLGLTEGQYDYTTTNGVLAIDANGTWTGMANTTVISKYVHLLLPNNVKKIIISVNSATGIKSVRWVSITANTGSQLEELERGTSKDNSCFGGTQGGWLERVDFTKATNLRTIPAWTFYQCDRLYDIALPETLTSIETNAIYSKGMVHVSLPAGLGDDGSGLNNNAFVNSSKIVEVELPSNANSDFETKVKGMAAINSSYLNVYKKGTGRSWLVTTSDGFIFCKNLSRTSALASGLGSSVTVEPTSGQISYAINKWYLVGYRGVESGGDAMMAAEDYMVTLPKQVDLDINGGDRSGMYDYIDCSGAEIQNDFSALTGNTSTLGSNVAINGSSRVIAGTSNGEKLRYDVGQYAFYYRWVYHTTIPDDTVLAIGNYAFNGAPMNTFNCGDVKYIGNSGLRFSKDTKIDLIFYAPSPNPFCSATGFIEADATSMKRVFVYRNYDDYADRNNPKYIGLYARMRDYAVTEGTIKFYTYLVDIVPNVEEWDESANAYKYVKVEDEKIQRLYAGSLSGYNKTLYDNPYYYVRQSDDNWRYDKNQTLPPLTEYTGYSKTSWFTSPFTDDNELPTKYTETLIGTASTSSLVISLRNAASKETSKINMYAKKIVSVTLENKTREYKDRSLQEDEPEITGIPTSIKEDYTVKVTKYVDSSGVEKTYQSIGSIIQEAGVYTIEIQPNNEFGEWSAEDVPTMTVRVNKTVIDLGNSSIFRVGVTNGVDNINLRPGKEVVGEQGTSLYQYNDSWYTDLQTDDTLGEVKAEKHGLWNSFVRAEGSNMRFSLTLITSVIADAHNSNQGIFTCKFPGTARSESGQYTDQFTVELTEAAKNNYKFVVTNDEFRQFYGYPEEGQTKATINKTWYIVRLNNWLTTQGNSGNDAPSYNMTVNNLTDWEFGTINVPAAPAVALGSPENITITFSLELTSPSIAGGIGRLTIGSNIPISQYSQYVNSSMPVGKYRIIYTVEFSNDDSTKYDRFQQSFSFTVFEKEFAAEEMAAIEQLREATFEYEMSTVTATYNKNDVLFDMSKLSSTAKLEDMLGLAGTPKWNTPRVGIWQQDSYNLLFDSNFKITYNLNRMWNNQYLDMDELINGDNPMNTPDVYVVYYQLTCKNRKSLIDPSNNNRRQCYFNVIVYRTLTAPQGIKDIVYTGEEIYPTISYLNGELAFEQAYYEVSFPSSQDNVNTGDKKIILTIDKENTQLYRWEADATKNVAEILYKIVPANNSTIVPLYIADWAWNSEITLDNIIWETQFGNSADYKYTLVPVKSSDEDNREEVSDINEFGTAAAGRYTLIAYCPADSVNGNWNEYSQERTVIVSPAGNTWIKTPSITSWSWNQYANYDWSSNVSPIEIHAIPTYYSLSTEAKAGSGRFDFRIYSIDETKAGNDRYNVVSFGDDFHFQYEKDGDGNFLTNGDPANGGHFRLPISIAKTLAALPAGQYYLVATVYSHNNYTGLNNSSNSFVQGAVPFTIASANNLWTDTITVTDWNYSEFTLGLNLHTGSTKYETQLKYSVHKADTNEIVEVEGVKLENVTDFTAVASGSTYKYVDLIKKLDVGSYIFRVHGDAAAVNDRFGVNYLAIDDQREVNVTKTRNTLNETFAVNNYTIGTDTDNIIIEFTARFDSQNVGYRIGKNGFFVDGLSNSAISDEILESEAKFTRAEVLAKIATLASADGGNDYMLWCITSSGDNYTAVVERLIFTVYLGQNDWKTGMAPTKSDWEYDGTRHEFIANGLNSRLLHAVDESKISVSYYYPVLDEYTGKYTRGESLGACPTDTGEYLLAITVPNDEQYKGFSLDLFFRVTMASNSFETNKEPAIKNSGWKYSQLDIKDIIIGNPNHVEDNMILQYVVYQSQSVGGVATDVRMATLTWELGSGTNVNNIALEAFHARINVLDVGQYKMSVTISSSRNYKEYNFADITLTVSQAENGWKDGKSPAIVDNVTQWEWQNESTMITWTEVATKFGDVSVYINGNAVAAMAVARYLSTLEVSDNHTIRFVVAETNNYEGVDETRSFKITKNKNGWSTLETDKPFVNDWTWRDYDNSNQDVWKQPKFNFGENTATATVYNKKDNSLVRQNVGLYALDILFSNLDAGSYYIVWSVVETNNYMAKTYDTNVEFKISPAQDMWVTNGALYENEEKQNRWTYGDNRIDQYSESPKALYGLVKADIYKYDDEGENPTLTAYAGLADDTSIENAIRRLGAGFYKIEWYADNLGSGNFLTPDNPEKIIIQFIVDRAIAELEGDKPYVNSWYWGSFNNTYWRSPILSIGEPCADVYSETSDGSTRIAENVTSSLLSGLLAMLNVGSYRMVWKSVDGDFQLEPIRFQVMKNRNQWTTDPSIEEKWQWQTFHLGRWQRPTAKYHNNDLTAAVYKLNAGEKFEYYDVDTWKPDLSKYTKMNEITLATFDEINNLSIGKYLVLVDVPEDVNGNYDGKSKWMKFEIVPNENNFTASLCYVSGYAYSEFRGYWRAPSAKFGEINATIYRTENGVRIEKLYEVSTYDLNDILRELHTGDYQIEWAVVGDAEGNYLTHTATSTFSVIKANNRWLSKPAIRDWDYGLYNSTIIPTAMPLAVGEESVYFKIVNYAGNEIVDFRDYAKAFDKDDNGNYYKDGRLVLTADGYFTDIEMVEEVVKALKPGDYHLLAYYPEMEDYNRLDTNNDYAFVIRNIENKWIELPSIKSWIEGSEASKPKGEAIHGQVNWTYYKAVYNEELGKYVISGEAIATDGNNPPQKVGKYILVAQTELVEGYAQLREEIFFEIFEKSITGASGNLLIWIDITLATIASIITAVIIYTLLKARSRKDDDVFNG